MSAEWTWRRQRVKCGKPGCPCAAGEGHGPYWYGFRRMEGRVESRYFGKRRPRGGEGQGLQWRTPSQRDRADDREAAVLAFTRRRPDWGKRSVARAVGGISAAGVLGIWLRRGAGTTRRTRAAWAAQPSDNKPGSLHKAALRLFGMRRESTAEQVKARYKELAKRHHPDTGGNTEKMQRINAAYEVLRRRA